MDPNESSGLNSYYQQQPPQQPVPPPPSSLNLGVSAIQAAATTTGANTNASPTNGMLPNNPTSTANSAASPPPPMVYPHSVPSAVSAGGLETVKRKRGRPRKYSTPEQAAAAKRLSSASSSAPMSSSRKSDQFFNSGGAGSASSSSKKLQLSAFGNPGQSFTPHVISVAAGEDVGQKIMMFSQQSKREICVLSASGTISNASLRQPATSGGIVSYEGQLEILSLSGSYVRNEHGGKAGGLSVCLAASDGLIVGGGVGGPLTAAGPIQVIVGTFLLDGKRDVMGATKGDGSAGKLPSPIAAGASSFSASGVSLRSPIDPSYQNIGGQFMIQHRGTHFEPPQSLDWMRDHSGNDVQQSPENGNYDHIPDLRS